MEPEIQKGTRKSKTRPYTKYLVAIVVIALLGFGGYYGYSYWSASPEANVAASDAQNEQFLAERNIVINKIKALTDVPNEEPEMFTVNDASLLKSEAFFKDAVNGDILLVFQASGRAILYRDSTNQIISTGPVSSLQTTATSTGE